MSAYIHRISIYGEMEIRFNATMFHDFNLTWLNETFVDIYMIPDQLDSVDNISNWNLTWNVTSYEDNILKIQLNFTNSSAISQFIEQDRIVFHLRNNDSNAFYSPEAGNYLHHEYWTLTSRVRKQLDESWRYWMDQLEKAVFWMKMLLLMCLLFMMIPGAFGFRYYMWYLRSL